LQGGPRALAYAVLTGSTRKGHSPPKPPALQVIPALMIKIRGGGTQALLGETCRLKYHHVQHRVGSETQARIIRSNQTSAALQITPSSQISARQPLANQRVTNQKPFRPKYHIGHHISKKVTSSGVDLCTPCVRDSHPCVNTLAVRFPLGGRGLCWPLIFEGVPSFSQGLQDRGGGLSFLQGLQNRGDGPN